MKTPRIATSLLLLLSGAASQVVTSPLPAAELEPLREILEGREVHEPQFVQTDSGSLLVLWREKSGEGSDLYVAEAADEPRSVRINDEVGTVGSYPMDELRAAVAAGPGSRVAVAWGDARGQVRVSESLDGGATWSPSRRLEQVEAPAYRSFPALAYDGEATLHGVWIDARFAEDFAEEPADLYYARISAGGIEEHNLTAEQEPSVCGCCRPYIESIGTDVVRVVFRNTTADGYRDVFSIEGGPSAGFGSPSRVGPPLWKLQGCPMSGPIVAASRVYWPDGSSGAKLLRGAAVGSAEQAPALDATALGEWRLRLPPRRVQQAAAGNRTLLLVPGRPSGLLVAAHESAATLDVLADDLPIWATSALLAEDTLWLMGAVSGEMRLESREFAPPDSETARSATPMGGDGHIASP